MIKTHLSLVLVDSFFFEIPFREFITTYNDVSQSLF